MHLKTLSLEKILFFRKPKTMPHNVCCKKKRKIFIRKIVYNKLWSELFLTTEIMAFSVISASKNLSRIVLLNTTEVRE